MRVICQRQHYQKRKKRHCPQHGRYERAGNRRYPGRYRRGRNSGAAGNLQRDGASARKNQTGIAQLPCGGTYSAQSPSSITIAWNEDKENTRFEENLERIITQKWIAMFPLGIEAWCEHRRTGYPKFLPIMDNKGVGITNLTLGIRRLSYPAEEYQLNAENMLGALRKLNGEDNGATRLWWDCNPNVK